MTIELTTYGSGRQGASYHMYSSNTRCILHLLLRPNSMMQKCLKTACTHVKNAKEFSTWVSLCRYRKVVLNNCTKGVKEMYTARKQQCPRKSPKGLSLTTKDGKLAANLGTNVTFLVHLDEVRTHEIYMHSYLAAYHLIVLL